MLVCWSEFWRQNHAWITVRAALLLDYQQKPEVDDVTKWFTVTNF